MGEEIIIQDENGKKYSVLRVLDADTKKIIDDLSALVVKKDKIIDLMANEIYIEHNPHFNTTEDVKKYFEERCK
jgi:hypothetical protein